MSTVTGWLECGELEQIELTDFPIETDQLGAAYSRSWRYPLPQDPEWDEVWLVVTVWGYAMPFTEVGAGVRLTWDTAVTTTPAEPGVGELWSDSRYLWDVDDAGRNWATDSTTQADLHAKMVVATFEAGDAAAHAQIVAPHVLGL